MPLIDTHTHLESFARKGVLSEVRTRARAAGLGAMITIGTSPADWGLYRTLAASHPGFIHYTVGLHPCSAEENWPAALARLEEFWTNARVWAEVAALPTGTASLPAPVALGEIGLDRFHLPKDPVQADRIFGWQRAAFAAGLAVARRQDCPVVIHSRGAFGECLRMIDESGIDWRKVVFHCFSEGEAEMAELLERGGFGSFTGILTYRNADPVRAAARAQGIDRLMLETDAPYLAPLPHRGEPNEPAYLRHTAAFAASEVFGIPCDELARTTTAMADAFFRLPKVQTT